MSTESVARDVINAAESAPAETPSAPASSNAVDYLDVAVEEMDHLMADDPTNTTRRVAAAMTVFHDQRPFVSTKQGMVRREFNDDGNPTRRAAREMIDQAAWAEGREAEPGDVATMHAHDFARDINRSAMDNTLPSGGDVFEPGSDEWHASGDAVIDAIIAQRGQR